MHITDRPPDGKYRLLLTTTKRPKGFKDPVGTGREYKDDVGATASAQGLSYPLLLAIIKTESNFNPRAVSPKGASGLMQLMPGTWKRYGVTDPFDPKQNIRAGTAFFRDMLARYNNNTTLALAAYNAGPGNVDKYGDVPPFDETQRYVKKVYWYQKYYQQKHGNVVLKGATEKFDDGFSALQSGNMRRAAQDFEQVVQRFPRSPEANYNLALAYERTNRLSLAIARYRRVLEIDPYFREAYYNLAIIYERIGRLSTAIRTWQTYLNYEPRSAERREVSKYIKELRQLRSQ